MKDNQMHAIASRSSEALHSSPIQTGTERQPEKTPVRDHAAEPQRKLTANSCFEVEGPTHDSPLMREMLYFDRF